MWRKKTKPEYPEKNTRRCQGKNIAMVLKTKLLLCWSIIWLKYLKLLLRPVHTRELAPETLSRNTLPGKYPNQYIPRTRRGSLLPQHAPATRSRSKAPSSAPTISSEKVCCATNLLIPSFARHFTASKFQYTATRELAPETDSCNRFAPGACSLISNQFTSRRTLKTNSEVRRILINV